MDEYEPPRQRKKPKVKESIIDHTYRDYSQVEVSSDDEAISATSDERKHTRLQPNFPAKLHAIVSNPKYQHIICWQPHGRSWKIVDKHLLSTVICPKHFAHAKFESFNRSVNGWGFKRLLNPGPDCKSYYHECFLRGRPELTKLMQRLVNPGKRLPDKAGEPDFYEISRKYPLPQLPSGPQDKEALAGMSPHRGRAGRAGGYFPPQAGGYPYGYYQAGPYPQMPSPVASGYGQPYPPQQAYWPPGGPGGQMPPGMYPPNPAAPYGYYPYPQMMAGPQGYDPQSYQHPSMYGQYYPGAAYGGPGGPPTPGRPDPSAQPQTQARPEDRTAGDEAADETDERKPPARTGVKRPLEGQEGGPDDAYPPRPTAPTHGEGSDPTPQEAEAGKEPGTSAKPTEGSDAAATSERAPAPAPGQGGDGINEQQLLQDFFQQY